MPHIYCLLRALRTLVETFSDWTDDDWQDPENLFALWDLSGHLTGAPGQALWARGTHDVNEMPKIGLLAPQFLQSAIDQPPDSTRNG